MVVSRLRPSHVALLSVVLLLGAVLSVWTASARTDCGLCAVNLPAAVLGNGLAGAGAALGIGLLAFGMVRSGDAMTNGRNVLIVLALGVLGAIIAVFALNDKAFVAESGISGTVAGTAIGIAFLYLAILLLFIDLMKGSSGAGASKASAIPAVEEDQHIMTIEGIGPKYATRLNARGIITIPQLLGAETSKVAQAAQSTSDLAGQWQAEGALIQVKGIGPQFAEMLALAGIRSVEQLARSDVDELLATIDAIEERRKVRVLKTDVQRHHVEKFVKAARAHIGLMD